MPRISSQTLDEINSRIDMPTLVGEYTRLEKRGNDYWGCCPFHNEKTPSFKITLDKNLYHCFGCHASGSLIQFYQNMEKISFPEAALALAKQAGIQVIYDGNATPFVPQNNTKDEYIELYGRISGTYNYFLTSSDMGKGALDYLKTRGISSETIETFQLGFSPKDRYWLKKFLSEKKYSDSFLEDSGLFSKNYPTMSFFSNRLMFPICNRHGQTIAFGGRILEGEGPKYLNSGDLVQYKKRENLYAFHLAKQHLRTEKCAIICEGYMDVIAYHQAGVKIAVAPLGTALTEEQVKLLSSFCDTFYLSFDSDKAGQEATYKSILLCRQHDISVRIIKHENGKDPAEILLNFGPENLTNFRKSFILDNEYLLSVLMLQYPANTPEGKTRICLAYFPYLDALQSDIHRESCIEYLCQTLHVSIDVVKEDYKNRDSAKKKLEYSPNAKEVKVQGILKPDAELRAILAVVANFDFFNIMRSTLSVDDFEGMLAREMFITLEECFREGAVSTDSILSRCSEDVKKIVTQAITSGEFAQNSKQVIEGSVQRLKQKSLMRKRERLINRMRQLQSGAVNDSQELNALLSEKMNIDFELNKL